MSKPTRTEGHLIVAAIRVLEHQKGRPPTPQEISTLLDLDETMVRLQLNALMELGVVQLVASAYETHAEIRDHLLVEELVATEGPEISEDLAAFDRRKEEEAQRMANLFESGDHQRKRQERLNQMDQELADFRERKPHNPFAED